MHSHIADGAVWAFLEESALIRDNLASYLYAEKCIFGGENPGRLSYLVNRPERHDKYRDE